MPDASSMLWTDGIRCSVDWIAAKPGNPEPEDDEEVAWGADAMAVDTDDAAATGLSAGTFGLFDEDDDGRSRLNMIDGESPPCLGTAWTWL